MALIPCPDCKSRISDKSSICINCGRPINGAPQHSHPSVKTWLVSITILALVGLIGFRIYSISDFSTSISQTKDILEESSNQNLFSEEPGPYARALIESDHPSMNVSEKKLTAMLMERELMVNQSTPRLVNPMLSLKEVNYQRRKGIFEYNYVVNDLLDLNAVDSRLQHGLDRRYCEENEFKIMRENGVRVVWRYWNKDGMLLRTLKSNPCR